MIKQRGFNCFFFLQLGFFLLRVLNRWLVTLFSVFFRSFSSFFVEFSTTFRSRCVLFFFSVTQFLFWLRCSFCFLCFSADFFSYKKREEKEFVSFFLLPTPSTTGIIRGVVGISSINNFIKICIAVIVRVWIFWISLIIIHF